MQDWAKMSLPILYQFPIHLHAFKYFSTIFSENPYIDPANIYLVKVNNRNTTERCEMCSKITIKTLDRFNDVVLVSLLLTVNIISSFSSVSVVDFEQINVCWGAPLGKWFFSEVSFAQFP